MNGKEPFRMLMRNLSLSLSLYNFLRRSSSLEELLNFLSIFLELNRSYQCHNFNLLFARKYLCLPCTIKSCSSFIGEVVSLSY